MANTIIEFAYDGGAKQSVQEITQNINQAVRAADLNDLAAKINEIITVVNDMNTIVGPGPYPIQPIINGISGVTINGTEVEITDGIANIAITVNGTEVIPDTNKTINLDMLNETITGTTVNCKLTNNTFTTCSDLVSELNLEIPSDICAMFQFTTSTDFTGGTLTIPETYFINNQISFDKSTTYLVSVDHNVIIWNEIEQYIPADNE